MNRERCACGRWAEGRHGPGENVCREIDPEVVRCVACGWPEHRTRTRSINAWGERVCADCWEDGIKSALAPDEAENRRGMNQRFTLQYTYPNGLRQTCFNLLKAGADTIERAQTHLGAHSFRRIPQDHTLSDEEIRVLLYMLGREEPCVTCEGGCAVCGSKEHDCREHGGAHEEPR